MKKMKKILALVLSAAMVMTMGITSLAAFEASDPTTSTATITLTKAAKETTAMNAYKVINATYDSTTKAVTYGLEKWVTDALEAKENGTAKYPDYLKTDGTTDVEKVILALGTVMPQKNGQQAATGVTNGAANAILDILSKASKTGAIAATQDSTTKTTFKFEDLKVGAYFVEAIDSVNVYNPIMVSVGLTADDNGVYTDVLGNKDWDLELAPKYTPIPFTKKVVGSTTGVNNGKAVDSTNKGIDKDAATKNNGEHGDDTNIGDTIHFEITNKVPTYSANYKDIVYTFNDTLSDGLFLVKGSIVIKVDGKAIADANVKEKKEEDHFWAFSLTDDTYIKSISGKPITITYDAVLKGDDVETGFDPNTNKATLTYTTKPDGTTNHKEDTTYHYTFEIDGNVGGQETKIKVGEEEWDVVGHEVIKVGPDKYVTKPLKKGETVDGYTVGHYTARKESAPETVYNGGLSGAIFTLTNNETKEVKTATTTADGYMNFVGLDAGSYTLVETKAPDGYSLDPTTHSVDITAEYNENGTLKKYEVKIDGTATTTYTAKYLKPDKTEYAGTDYLGTTVIPTISKDADASTLLKNTKLASLPSTGGIGTTIFTIAGCLIMILAAGMFFATKRKEEK